MPTEAEFELDANAIAGRKLLNDRLERFGEADVQAFWEAVQRCYASGRQDDE